MKEKLIEALKELRKSTEKKKFDQTLDLIVNLKNFDFRKESVNAFILMPHEGKSKKICAFLDTSSQIFDKVILKAEIEGYKDKKAAKELAKDYDFFIAIAPLMPTIATLFGRIFGPLGKMPDPKSGGVLMRFNENEAKELMAKLKRTVKIKTKESAIKIALGKESQKDEILAENIEAVLNATINALPKKKENIKSVMLKFTMSKPIKIKI